MRKRRSILFRVPLACAGLRIGLVENTKKNAEEVLRNLAKKLGARHSMTMTALVHKPQRAPVKDSQIAELKGKTDFVITGVGDRGACRRAASLMRCSRRSLDHPRGWPVADN
jgi:hypothetical protein